MARRKPTRPPGKPPTELVPRLREAVEVVDEALDRLAREPKPARRRRVRPPSGGR